MPESQNIFYPFLFHQRFFVWKMTPVSRKKDSKEKSASCQPPFSRVIWVFPKIGVPQNGWLKMENPIKMEHPIFGTPHIGKNKDAPTNLIFQRVLFMDDKGCPYTIPWIQTAPLGRCWKIDMRTLDSTTWLTYPSTNPSKIRRKKLPL